MSTAREIELPIEWSRSEYRSLVIARIRESSAPVGVKRSRYLRWLVETGTLWLPEELDDVVPQRPRAYPTAEELR